MAARSSQPLLCWRLAVSMASWKQSSAARDLLRRLRAQELTLESVKLGLLATLVGLFADSQPFIQRTPRLFESAGSGESLAQRAELERQRQPGSAGAKGLVTLPEEGQCLLGFPLAEAGRRP